MAKQNRVVLVTGAAGGIGLAITNALIAAGHIVAAVDRDAAALGRLDGIGPHSSDHARSVVRGRVPAKRSLRRSRASAGSMR